MIIKNGRVVDPKHSVDAILDILVEDGKILQVAENICVDDAQVIDATGCIVAPGLIDVHVHFRDPGLTDKEDIESGSRAAARGGFTTVCCMPNTNPVIDNLKTLKYVDEKGKRVGLVNLLVAGAMSKGLEGKVLSDIGDMYEYGICALTDDGKAIESEELMRTIAQIAAEKDILIMDHIENIETLIRDIKLAKEFGCRMHLQHLNTKECVERVRDAKSQGIKVICETAPHYLHFTSAELATQGSNAKMNPPLGGEDDRRAIIAGLLDGTIDMIATDHAPHTEKEKALPLDDAPFGIIGLETAFASTYEVLKDKMSLEQIVSKMSTAPAKLLNLDRGGLGEGDVADIVIIEEKPCAIDKNEFDSKGRNTPFHDMKVNMEIKTTILGGEVTYDRSTDKKDRVFKKSVCSRFGPYI